jgi:hypothetical protein
MSQSGDVVIPTLRVNEWANANDRTQYPGHLNLVDLYLENKDSIVEVNGDKTKIENGRPVEKTALGTGFFVSGDGRLVTDYHVVQDARNLRVQTADGRVYRAIVEDVEPASDLAMLRLVATKDKTFKTAQIAESSAMQYGEEVTSLGHPQGWDPIYAARGRYLEHRSLREVAPSVEGGLIDGENINRSLINTEIHIEPGNSGGPLYNREGKVVGVIGLTNSSDSADSTPVEALNRFLNRNGISPSDTYSAPSNQNYYSSRVPSYNGYNTVMPSARPGMGGYETVVPFKDKSSSPGALKPPMRFDTPTLPSPSGKVSGGFDFLDTITSPFQKFAKIPSLIHDKGIIGATTELSQMAVLGWRKYFMDDKLPVASMSLGPSNLPWWTA